MGKVIVQCLLALSAPWAQGVGLKLELKPEFKPELRPELQPERGGGDAVHKTQTMTEQALRFFRSIENASSEASRPLLLISQSNEVVASRGDFMPSEEFLSSGQEQKQEQGQGHRLPWGVSNIGNSNFAVHQGGGDPFLAFSPAGLEYSLEAGGNMQTFNNRQDIKIICQVLFNVTNGYYIDSNGGDGEFGSNTLLLELLGGWRGLIVEPNIYTYASLWTKMRKAWLFLGCISPHENATKIGWGKDENIDENSGHQIHAYTAQTFLQEMGGLRTVDFWNVHTGNYEAEVLNETLLYSGSSIEFGVVLVTFDGRTTGLGDSPWVQSRSKADTETLIFEIFAAAGFTFIGNMDPVLLDDLATPSYEFNSRVFVNPAYFTARNLYVPTSVRSPPPPQTSNLQTGAVWQSFWDTWDEGMTHDQEVDCAIDYRTRSRAATASTEAVPYAHRSSDVSHTPLQHGVAGTGGSMAPYNPTRPPQFRAATD